MENPGTIRKVYNQLERLPAGMRAKAFTLVFNGAVKFAGTASQQFTMIEPQRAVVQIKNRRKVQNHIGSVHAVACTLCAESATGVLVAMNLPAGKVNVLKRMEVDFPKRAKGDMTAEAWVTDEQAELMRTADKGEAVINVKITDGDGREPVVGKMIWAWTPNKR